MGDVAKVLYPDCEQQFTASAAIAASKILQSADGRAGYLPVQAGVASGDKTALVVEGAVTLPKTATIVCLRGGNAYWVRSTSKVTPLKSAGDFWCGTFANDAASADTTCNVMLNLPQVNKIDLMTEKWVVANAGSGAAAINVSNERTLDIIATNEAEKTDFLSTTSIPIVDGPIFEARVTVVTTGAGSEPDFNFGLANATHATDADSITEHVFFHIDGNSTAIRAQSKDGTTTVASTDTTVVYVASTYQEFWIDARKTTDVRIYVDGVRVLASSTFKLNAGTGPMKALVHAEKTTSTTLFHARVLELRVRATDLGLGD